MASGMAEPRGILSCMNRSIEPSSMVGGHLCVPHAFTLTKLRPKQQRKGAPQKASLGSATRYNSARSSCVMRSRGSFLVVPINVTLCTEFVYTPNYSYVPMICIKILVILVINELCALRTGVHRPLEIVTRPIAYFKSRRPALL